MSNEYQTYFDNAELALAAYRKNWGQIKILGQTLQLQKLPAHVG